MRWQERWLRKREEWATRCAVWHERVDRVWYDPRMLKWGRLGVVLASSLLLGLLYHESTLNVDRWLIALVVASWITSLLFSVKTTHVYGARGLGIFGTVSGDILFYGVILLIEFHIGWHSEWTSDFIRGFFTIGAPLMAFGLYRAWRRQRRMERGLPVRQGPEDDDDDSLDGRAAWTEPRH